MEKFIKVEKYLCCAMKEAPLTFASSVWACAFETSRLLGVLMPNVSSSHLRTKKSICCKLAVKITLKLKLLSKLLLL